LPVRRQPFGVLTRSTFLALAVAVTPVSAAFGQTPPAQTPPAPQLPAAPPAAFPAEAKVGYVNLQAIFNQSALGQQAAAQVQTLQDSLSSQLAARDKEMQALADKIRTQQGAVSQSVIIGWNNDLERQQREAQFAQQEAQVQVDQLKQGLLDNFEQEVVPVIEAVRAEKGLWIILSVQSGAQDAAAVNLVAAAPGLDLSAEIVGRLNARK
jgi:outer membrane protein